MFTAYWLEDSEGDVLTYLFVSLPEDVLWLPVLTEKDRRAAIAAVTSDGAIHEQLPNNGPWEMRGLVWRLTENYRRRLTPKGTVTGYAKKPNCEVQQVIAERFEDVLTQLEIKPSDALLRYAGQ